MKGPIYTMELCNGSMVDFVAELEETECYECGQSTGSRVTNEPPYHDWSMGDRCLRCDEEMGDFGKLTAEVERQIVQKLADELKKENVVYKYLKKRQR